MPVTREQLEQEEIKCLASYAQTAGSSRGRVHEESNPTWRTQFQRDRDRIIHSRAFRRLEYKTQVFLNGSGDHLRTRLTHTIEVAAIARNLARALRLNEDLAESIALAHDLGHSPFGHNGECVLNSMMKDHGGFEHNRQSLRIVEDLEQKYPSFHGLNLTWEVREGLMKHQTGFDHPQSDEEFEGPNPSLEAQIANLADEITYYSHDLDDGLESGLLKEEDLTREVEIWSQASGDITNRYKDLEDECRHYFIIRCIIDGQIRDVVHTAETNINRSRVKTPNDVRKQENPLIDYSPEHAIRNSKLRKYLFDNLYSNPVVHDPNKKAVRMLKQIFEYYLEHPEEIGSKSRKRSAVIGKHRAICDYLSGMTDRYAIQEHHRLFGVEI